MKLKSVTVGHFRNFVSPQTVEVEGDVTCLVGKNESGKTTVLKALHRLNPANGASKLFDLTTEYPRWRLARDRRKNPDLKSTEPVSALFSLDVADRKRLSELFDVELPAETVCKAERNYANKYFVSLQCDVPSIVRAVANEVSFSGDDLDDLIALDSVEEVRTAGRALARDLKESEPLRSKAATALVSALGKLEFLESGVIADADSRGVVASLIPKFFYFSDYDVLPGETDLTRLAEKIDDKEELTAGEQTVVALLAHAGEGPSDFLDADYDSRKAELQAASVDLSQRAFEYWRQNTDLEVVFDTDNVVKRQDPQGNEIAHRILKIELRDGRHGNVETNFSTRSAGFQWFFSFFAAFSEYQDSKDSIIILLDEPGTSLHGEAQKDFVRFIYGELGSSKQTIYTTHSQHMVDPAKYEKLRAVHDRATKSDPDQGVVVTRADFRTDRETILPLEAALGYTISQHLFIGSGQHLTVEGSSDFVYLQRMTEHLQSVGKSGLDARLAIISVGGADNMPAFVALLGRRLKVSALIDGARTSSKIARVRAAAEHNDVPAQNVLAVSEIDDSLPANSDIEDVFDAKDYLKLYNLTFGANLKVGDLPDTSEPILKRLESLVGKFDHALPAHALTEHRDEFLKGVSVVTINNFERLFARLNATVIE